MNENGKREVVVVTGASGGVGRAVAHAFREARRTHWADCSRHGLNVWITMVQLPAVNTPQFNWCRTKLPDYPQPGAADLSAQVPAEAVYWAAHQRRRELDVGGSAVKAIFGNKLAPRFADWYLARTSYKSEQIQDAGVAAPAVGLLRTAR